MYDGNNIELCMTSVICTALLEVCISCRRCLLLLYHDVRLELMILLPYC